MKLSKSMQKCVQFAKFVQDHKIVPAFGAVLLMRAHRAFKAGEREANTGISADPARAKFEETAKLLGFRVKWPGLLPMLTKRGRDIYLPDC